jgi:hypothetical protein
MGENDLEDLWRDYWTRLNQLYQGIIETDDEEELLTLMATFLIPYVPSVVWRLFCWSSCSCTEGILHTLSILQHISTHHTCHHQGVFAVIMKFSNCVLYDMYIHSQWNTCTNKERVQVCHFAEFITCEKYILRAYSWFYKLNIGVIANVYYIPAFRNSNITLNPITLVPISHFPGYGDV